MFRRILASVLLFVYQVEFGDAVSMESCPLVAVENKETVVRCTGINSNDKVLWKRIKGSTETDAGLCEPLPADCVPVLPGLMNLTRPSADVSTMTITFPTRSLFGGATIRCDTQSGVTDTGSDSCQMDVIYPAQVTSVSVQHAHGTWKATGSCDVTKVFSFLSRYSCQWYRGTSQTSQSDLLSSTSYNTSDITGDTNYRRGTCSFTADIPPTSGTYYYRVVVHPGGTENVSGPVTVDEPSTPTITSCSPDLWAPIGSQLMCTCNTNDIGQPTGRLQWVRDGSVVKSGNYGDNSLSTTQVNLTQGDDGSQFTCRVEWIQDKQSATHTVRVAWGPNKVSIPQSGTFDTDSSGSRDLSLSCNATDVNPSTNLAYSWTGRCQGNTGSTCRLQPKPSGDDGMVVGCTVTNPYNNNQQRQGSYTLDLNYPPLSAPVIKGYTTGQAVYADDSLSLTCEVSGGKPLVTSVTFACQSPHPDNLNDVTASGSVSSSLDVSLTQHDDNVTCSCTARWKVAAYYRDSANTTLTVYYPPSTPAISRTDNLPFPYLEGDTVRLSCDLQSRGKPTANLTWSGHGNGQITNPDGAPATLVMTSIGKKDNNRNITCRTSNAWTQYKGQDISYVFPLQVYYSPQIRMTSQEGSNRCQLIENTAQCVVIQGQRVHFTCSADSNPPPATIVWRKNNSQDGDLDIGVGPDLNIQSANHTKHNGNFSCHVTTGNLQGTGRTRNPLTSSDQLTVLVKYIPERSSLFLSHVTGSLTVSEGDDVVLACLADGRPTPDMTLVKKETGSRVHYVKGGVLVVEDRDSWLNYNITSAQCSDTGTYTCTTRNDVGTGPETSGAIFVNCKPRSATPPAVDVPSVNYVNQSVHLTFNLWALPVPDRYEILYLGQFRNQTAARVSGIAFDVQCIVTGELYNISCDVTVVNVTDDTAAGFYQLNVTNTHGHEQLVFQVKYNEPKSAPPPAPPPPPEILGAVVGGTVAGVGVIAVVAAGVFLLNRRRRGKQASGSSGLKTRDSKRAQTEEPEMINNSLYGTATKNEDDGSMIVNSVYESSGTTGDRKANASNVRRGEYEEVGVEGNTPLIAPDATKSSASAEDVGPLYSKSKAKSEQNQKDSGTLFSSVDKSKKTGLTSSGDAAGGKGEIKAKPVISSKPDVKPKPPKDDKPSKIKKNKGKAKQKQGEREPLDNGRDKQKGPVYGNMTPLSMRPMEASVYENYAFNSEEAHDQSGAEGEAPNKDGLVYTTIQFTENQLKKAEEEPPTRETTEYVSIDFTKHVPMVQD